VKWRDPSSELRRFAPRNVDSQTSDSILAIMPPTDSPRGRDLHVIGSSLKDLAEMPLEIRRSFGRALRAA
jgi:hypothetical protein